MKFDIIHNSKGGPVSNVKLEKELKVITPNEPGILSRVLGTLANANVNLRAMFAFSDKKNGVFHLLTSDNNKAAQCLKILGYKVNENFVVTTLIDDRIGAGAEIGALLASAIIDVNYSYGSSTGSGKTLLVFNTSNNKKAFQALK